MVELPHISNPFKRRSKDLSDEELLEEIEKDYVYYEAKNC